MLSIEASPRQIAACEALVYNLLQRCEAHEGKGGVAVGLVSAHPGAGVSHIQNVVNQMLNENESHSSTSLDCVSLGIESEDWAELKPNRVDVESNAWSSIVPRTMLGKYRDRVEHLNALRSHYRYVLLDCHSLKQMTDVLGLASLIEGIIIVVEANRTTKSQLRYLERSIEEHGGRILGTVLNKRTYPIPQWINHLMERSGI